MFDWLYIGLGYMLGWFSDIMGGSYALALLLYALVFKILFLPFSIKQQKNQIALAKLTPKIELIKAKYRGRTDQVTMRKQQEEIMELQRKEGYSPLSGCLPMLLQLPIIIFLYNVIRKPLSYIARLGEDVITTLYSTVNAGQTAAFKDIDQILLIGNINKFTAENGAGAIEAAGLSDLSVLPRFDLWGLNLADKPYFWSWLLLIPVLAAAFQWLTMFVSRKVSGNANQLAMAGSEQDKQAQMSLRIMDLVMPLMTLFITFGFSSMMGLYWIFQSVLGMIQTVILAKAMPIPRFTEEEIKAIRKAQKAQEKAQKEIIKTQPKYKSLHYIDEDDYDELPEMKQNKPASNASKDFSSQDKPEIKD